MSKLQEKCLVYRAKHELSQKQLADMCGVSYLTIRAIEKGQSNITPLTQTKVMLVVGSVEHGE